MYSGYYVCNLNEDFGNLEDGDIVIDNSHPQYEKYYTMLTNPKPVRAKSRLMLVSM